MNKKWILASIGSALALIGFFYFFFYSENISLAKEAAPSKDAAPAINSAAINELPNLTLTQTDGSKIALRELGGQVSIIFFNSECDHCQTEAKSISEKKASFANQHLYFVSIESTNLIARFAAAYKLEQSNFHFCQVDPSSVYNAVGPLDMIPTIFAYKDKKLVKRFDGQTSVEDLLNVFVSNNQ